MSQGFLLYLKWQRSACLQQPHLHAPSKRVSNGSGGIMNIKRECFAP